MIIKGAMCLHVSVLCRLYKSQNSLYIFHEIKLMNVRDAFKDQWVSSKLNANDATEKQG